MAKTTVVLVVEIVEGERQTLELTDYVPNWVFVNEQSTESRLFQAGWLEMPEPSLR